jgi:glycosyltransferase involved in cell wall biosynthesis
MATDLAIGLKARGLSPVLIALDEGGVQETMLANAGIPCHIMGGRRIKEWSFHRSLAAILRRLNASVVHTHMFAPLIHTLPAITLARVPRVVHTEHSFEYLEPHASNQRILKFVSRATKVFTLVGERMMRFYADTVGVPRQRLRVIPNGVDVEQYRPVTSRTALRAELGLPLDGFIVGSAGRLSHEKNFNDLMSAVGRCRALGGRPHLAIFGEGAERAALESQAASSGLKDAVTFLGWRTELPRLLGALDVFALCSNAEGLPLALLEAMAAGLPSVCTPVGDIPIIVENDLTGFLFPIGDVGALTDHVRRLELQPELRNRLGSRARKLMEEKYSRVTMIDRYMDAYAF